MEDYGLRKNGRVYCFKCGFNGFKPNKHTNKRFMTCSKCGTKNRVPFKEMI